MYAYLLVLLLAADAALLGGVLWGLPVQNGQENEGNCYYDCLYDEKLLYALFCG